MFIGSRVESEWRVEGESHSLTDALYFWLVPCAVTLIREPANLKVHIMLWDYSVIPYSLCHASFRKVLRIVFYDFKFKSVYEFLQGWI